MLLIYYATSIANFACSKMYSIIIYYDTAYRAVYKHPTKAIVICNNVKQGFLHERELKNVRKRDKAVQEAIEC